jgi:hypothetical protein
MKSKNGSAIALKAIALIVLEPREIYLDFLLTFSNYDIYIIIDSDKDQEAITSLAKYKGLNFVQFDKQLCRNNGFQNVNYIGVNKLISGWDKALLFFSVIISKKYKHVWFIEDDVFFLKEQLLTDLDGQYPKKDLIANCDFKSQTTNNIAEFPWLWSQIDINISKPHYSGMMCIARLSNRLLQKIKWYATTYKTLFFLEALFPTITSHFSLSSVCPEELVTVTFRDVFFEDTLDKDLVRLDTHIFHPIKDLNKQLVLRTNKLQL